MDKHNEIEKSLVFVSSLPTARNSLKSEKNIDEATKVLITLNENNKEIIEGIFITN